MNDIELAQIERYYKEYEKIDQESEKIIKVMIEKYKKFISENLNQTIYPYLANSIRPQFQALTDETSKKYFLISVLSIKSEIKRKMYNFFCNLTQVNLYGVSSKLKESFNKEVIESNDFKKFSEKLSKWHCHVEMIVFYMELLSILFNAKFDFKKNIFSLDKNFHNNTDIYIKKNFYKLASTLVSKVSLSPDIDYKKVLTFAITSVTAGINLAGLPLLIPSQQIGRIIGIFGINFLAGKLSDRLTSKSQFVEFDILSKLVEKLNLHLYKIEKMCYKLIILELQEEINTDLETSKVNIIKAKKDEIGNLLEVYLKGVDYSLDIEKKVQEEYVILNECITEEEFNDEWLFEHLSIKETQPKKRKDVQKENGKEKKNEKDNKKKDNGMFDDFVDISMDDF